MVSNFKQFHEFEREKENWNRKQKNKKKKSEQNQCWRKTKKILNELGFLFLRKKEQKGD